MERDRPPCGLCVPSLVSHSVRRLQTPITSRAWPSPSTARLSAAGLFSENRKSNELITVELNGVRKRILITVRLGVRLRGTDGTFSVMTDIKLFCSDD